MVEERLDKAPGDLEAWFAAARNAAPEPDARFLSRLVQDAADVAARRDADANAGSETGTATPLPLPDARRNRTTWRRAGGLRGGASLGGILGGLVSGLGGWRGLSGLAVAGVSGLWIGAALPEAVSAFAPGTTAASETPLDLLAAADSYFGEG